jgi:hypothetical protein
MRWLIRSLIFWAICAPLFYLFGLPYLMGKLEAKAQADSYMQCQQHLQKEGMVGSPTAILKAPQADSYCHCVADAMKLEKSDLVDLIQKKQPERLQNAMKPLVDACNQTLQQGITETVKAAPPTRTEVLPDGTHVIHFN